MIFIFVLSKFSCFHIDGLMQERHSSIANALELRLSCIYPLKWDNFTNNAAHALIQGKIISRSYKKACIWPFKCWSLWYVQNMKVVITMSADVLIPKAAFTLIRLPCLLLCPHPSQKSKWMRMPCKVYIYCTEKADADTDKSRGRKPK